MTSKERVLAAVNHQQSDRVPIDFGGHRSSGIMAIAYAKLKKYLGIHSGDIYVYDFVQQLAIVEPDVLDVLEIDVTEMGRGYMHNANEWQDWTLPDGTPCKIPGYIHVEKRGDDWILFSENGTEVGIQKKGCLYFEQTHFPMIERAIQDDDFSDLKEILKNLMWSTPHPGGHLPLDAEGLKQLATYAKALRESSDRAIVGLFGGNLFEVPQWLYRIDNYMMNMALYPEAVYRLSEMLTDIYLANLEKWLGAVGKYIDIVLFGDDLGGQKGPLISPVMYREFYKPFHKKMWQRAKELADVKINLHSCGAIEPFLDDLIDAGLDIINPVQIACTGMDAESLKRKYGDRMCFWGGGCDTQHILPMGTTQAVADHVRKQVSTFKPGGGFVFQQVHNIMVNVPPENIVTMFKSINS
ncbi:methyltransferase [candidate division KSB1 bacterium]|nr:methyltransferase [candidate division KSB1 bacterium]